VLRLAFAAFATAALAVAAPMDALPSDRAGAAAPGAGQAYGPHAGLTQSALPATRGAHAAPTRAAPAGHTGRARAAVPWRPDVAAARRFARRRAGAVSFAVRTEGSFYGLRPRRAYSSASVVKAMLLVAYLNDRRVRRRPLRREERSLLNLMVRHSSNRAATRVRDVVGNGALERLADRVRMRDFATARSWGATRITAADQARLMLRIDRLTVRRHRGSAMRLLGSVVRTQRWGVTEAVPPGWKLSFKSGWRKGTEHQVALLRRGEWRIAIAILSDAIPLPSHRYAKRTIAGVAKRLLRDLEPSSVPR
jgi:hypothetical protein